MGKGTDVGMRQQWGVLWLPWCRLPFIVTTGPDAAAKNSKDTYSKDLSALGATRFTKAKRQSLHFLGCRASVLPSARQQREEQRQSQREGAGTSVINWTLDCGSPFYKHSGTGASEVLRNGILRGSLPSASRQGFSLLRHSSRLLCASVQQQ